MSGLLHYFGLNGAREAEDRAAERAERQADRTCAVIEAVLVQMSVTSAKKGSSEPNRSH